jgi:hypothetical protein
MYAMDAVFAKAGRGRGRHSRSQAAQGLRGVRPIQPIEVLEPWSQFPGFTEVESMFHSRLAEATLIGCLTALASFCALSARAGETYSVVAQSNRFSAATGRRPLSERIAAANLPIIAETTARPPQATARQIKQDTPARAETALPAENMAVAAVRVDEEFVVAPEPPPRHAVTPPVLWPFGTKRTATTAPRPSTASKQAVATGKATNGKATNAASQPVAGGKNATAGRDVQRQANARSSGKGLSSSSPASVTR